MSDMQLIDLLTDRDEKAVQMCSEMYGKYANAIAYNILENTEDAEECVNDTLLRVWNSIPPARPSNLKAYIGKIARNISLDVYREKHAEKRGAGQYALALDELDEVIGEDMITKEIEAHELTELLDRFIAALPKEKRELFMSRYWYFDSIADISKKYGYTQSKVKVTLMRIRQQLREYLKREDYDL